MRRKRRSTYNIYARKNWFSRNKVWVFSGLGFIALVIAFFIIYFTSIKKPEDVSIKYEEMTAASLPTLGMIYSGHEVNLLHGYTQEMDVHYVRRNIYLLEDTYDIPIRIHLYGTKVTDVSFKVMDAQEDNLIQTGTVTDLSSEEELALCTVQIDNLIEDNKEYILDMIVTDNYDQDIHYYTRLKRDSSTSLAQQIETALYFNQALFDATEEPAKSYVEDLVVFKYWMVDNTDLSLVTLNSSLVNVTWTKMKATALTEPAIEILDVDEDIGYIVLNFMITRDELGTAEYYTVSEFYRIRVNSYDSYIMNYERTTDQIFNPEADGSIGTTYAKIGILSSDVVERKCNNSGTLSCFVEDGALWAMDTDTKTIKEIFSFAVGFTDTRGNYDQHDIKIVNVSDEGDIQFVIYGYMNSGLHEGKCGIAMYNYHAESEEVEEVVFIPSNLQYEILKNSIGNLFYLSTSSNDLYIMIDQYLYRLDLDTDEAELITGGLVDGSYVIQNDSRLIAWHEDSRVNDAYRINVLNLDTGESYTVDSDIGYSIKALGFLNEEFAYGQGKNNNIYEEQNGTQHLLLDSMYVINDELEIQEQDDADEGSYFIESSSEFNRVVLKEVNKVDGEYTVTGDFTLFATELDFYPTLSVYSQYEEVKKNCFYVEFADSTTSAGDLNINKDAVVLFTDAKTIDITDMLDSELTRYYVYAKGEVKDIKENAAEAIDLAYEELGIVLRQDGSLFYKRGVLPSEAEMSSTILNSSLEKIKNEQLINVTGITMTEAMYYIGNKLGIVWELNDKTYLLTGYDQSDNITLYDTETGEVTYKEYNDAASIFTTEGHVYVLEQD